MEDMHHIEKALLITIMAAALSVFTKQKVMGVMSHVAPRSFELSTWAAACMPPSPALAKG